MFFRLLLLFIVTPILEMVILIELGKRFGTLHTIGLIVITGIIGAWLAKSQGLKVYQNLRASLYNGEMPHNHLIDGFLILIGGALLITPGILTDLVGFGLVLPWTRKFVREKVKGYFKGRIVRIHEYREHR